MTLPHWAAGAAHILRNEMVRWAALLAGVTFLLAAFFVVLVAQPTIAVADGTVYNTLARRIAEDLQYGPYGYPYPLYPMFLAAIYWLGGDLHAVYLVQGALLGLVAGLSYWLARQVAGHRSGILAALLVMLDASLLGNVGLLITENLQTLLLLLALIGSLYAIGQEKARFHGAAGILWGLLTLVKPTTILWPLVLLPVYALVGWRRGWLLSWAIFMLAFALTVSPWLLRNQLGADNTTLGQPFPALLHHVFDEGYAKYDSTIVRRELATHLANAEAQGIDPGSIQFELQTLRLLWERIERSPTAYLRFVWGEFSYFWTEPSATWPDAVYDGNARFPQGYREVPGFSDYARLRTALVVMGVLALLLLLRRRPQVAVFVSAFLLYFSLFYTMTVVDSRFSSPIIPLVLVGAATFPALAMAEVKEKLVGSRLLINVLLAAVAVALVTVAAVYFYLQRPNFMLGGSFETERAEEEWTFVEEVGEPRAPLVVQPNRARDGFRSAILQIGSDERGKDTRMRQDVPVWFAGRYRLTFSYLFVEEALGSSQLYVEVLEWDTFEEGWKRVRKEFQPVVTNTWMEQEYEFEVGGSAHTVSIVFGMWDKPGSVLIDNVRLELAASVGEVIERPYLLLHPKDVNASNYLPLEKWVNTQPEANRAFLLSNPGVAKANGWKGDEGTLERAARFVGAGCWSFGWS